MMQRIVFDCERMKNSNTGLYHYCLNLGYHLQKHAENSEDLTFYSPSNALNRFEPGTTHLIQNSLQKYYMPSLSKFDIWHCTFQLSWYVPQRNRKIKVILTIHDLNFMHENISEAKKMSYLRRLQRNIDRSDAIICISDFARQDLLTYCNIGNRPLH